MENQRAGITRLTGIVRIVVAHLYSQHLGVGGH